jgi:excisionase family DNA binding protein
MTERLFFRVTEVAEIIGVSKSKAYELVANGTIPSVRIGGLLRVPAEVLRKLAEIEDSPEGPAR